MPEQDHSALIPEYLNGSLDAARRRELEAALQRSPALQAELEFWRGVAQRERALSAPEATEAELEFGLRRLLRDVRAEPPPRVARDRTPWWRSLAIAASLIVMLQSVLLLRGPQAPDPGYRMLSGIEAGATLQVTFAEDATAGQIRALLERLQLEVVGGPTALGVWRLALPQGQAPAPVIEMLQSQGDVVEHVAAD